MKVTTVGCVVHKFSKNLYKHENSLNKCSVYWANHSVNNHVNENNTFAKISSVLHFFYKTLRNHFHNWNTSIKVTSLNSIIKMYHFQMNILFNAYYWIL